MGSYFQQMDKRAPPPASATAGSYSKYTSWEASSPSSFIVILLNDIQTLKRYFCLIQFHRKHILCNIQSTFICGLDRIPAQTKLRTWLARLGIHRENTPYKVCMQQELYLRYCQKLENTF